MKIPNHFDDVQLSELLEQQKKYAWDLEASINWQQGIDFSKYLLPLDQHNLVFLKQKISSEERLVISQFIGLILASTFSEMEIALGRMRSVSWEPFAKNFALNPEIIALGEEFFEEEAKHAKAFDRYTEMFANGLGVDLSVMKTLLPEVKPGLVEKLLRNNALKGGMATWWIVCTVEEESMLIFRQMKPHKDKIDPLYFELHQKHFEEEARHSPFAFLLLRILKKQNVSFFEKIGQKIDFVASEIIKGIWFSTEIAKVFRVRHLKNEHEFFKILANLLPKLKGQSFVSLIYTLLSETPYLSPFLNYKFHPYLTQTLKESKTLTVPLPTPHFVHLDC